MTASEPLTWDEIAAQPGVRVSVTLSTGPASFRTKQDVRDHIAQLMRFIPVLPDEEPVEDNFDEVCELDAATRAEYRDAEASDAAAVLGASIGAGTPVITGDDPEDDGGLGWRPGFGRAAAPEVCGLPAFGDGERPCPLFAGHEPLPGCPGDGERASLRIAGGAA